MDTNNQYSNSQGSNTEECDIVKWDRYEDDGYNEFDESAFQRLKHNDPTATYLQVLLNCNDSGECFFNSIDWENDGNCIANNKYLKRIEIIHVGRCLGRPSNQPYVLGEQGQNLPTKQQLQNFFSCVYRNRSINYICIDTINIEDDFGASLIEGLGCHHNHNIIRLDFRNVTIGKILIDALGKLLRQPKLKLKYLGVGRCQLIDDTLEKVCHALVGNSTITSLSLGSNEQITSVGWQALSAAILHSTSKLTNLSLNSTGLTDDTLNILGSASGSLNLSLIVKDRDKIYMLHQ